MPHKTRLQIILLLEKKETATTAELSRQLHVTPANIRHHISILLRQGSIKLIGYGNNVQRGRPAAIYALAQPHLKENLDILTHVLLDRFFTQSSLIDQADTLKWIAQQIIAKYTLDTSNPTKRLYSTIRVLNSLNYQAHWEAHDTPRIMLTHCPYFSILELHPEMCKIDAFIIEILTGQTVSQTVKLALTSDNRRHCIFQITNK